LETSSSEEAFMPRSQVVGNVVDAAKAFAERDAQDVDAYPSENIDDLKHAGALLAPFPRALGGAEAPLTDMVAVTRAVAEASPSTALIASMPIGFAGVCGMDGSAMPEEHRKSWEGQREKVASEARAGKLYAACNSEKGAGGSLKETKTTCERGEDGVYRLSGDKILASSGRFADYFFSTARLPVPEGEEPQVEFFVLRTGAPGVEIMQDWDGFGMRSTESQSVRYTGAPAEYMMGYPGFIDGVQPLPYWFCLFAAIPLGCATSILRTLATPAPQSPALRLRFSDALTRIEALSAYLDATAARWRPAAGAAYAQRVLRTKTYVTQESTKLCAELFALSGGRHYSRKSAVARALADSFAGTALRPPLALALDQLVGQFDTALPAALGGLSGDDSDV
jgi:alkylation response protein AidB-like acyl-CoA dehydrogenase